MFNIITCSGFSENAGGYVASAPCMKSRIGIVLLFFIIAIVRKWGGEEIGIEFNFLFALLGGIVGYFIIVTLFGSLGASFLVGVAGALVGGYGSGFLGFGGGGDE